MTRQERAQARFVWMLVSFVIFGIGGGVVWWPASQHIALVRAHARESYEEANVLQTKLQRAEEVRAAKRRLENDVRELGGATSETLASASLLRLLSEESRTTGVSVDELAPDSAAATADVLPGINVAFNLRGTFRNVLAFLADLPRHDALVDVRDASLQVATVRGRSAVLNVTVHATLYHLTSNAVKETADVRPVR